MQHPGHRGRIVYLQHRMSKTISAKAITAKTTVIRLETIFDPKNLSDSPLEVGSVSLLASYSAFCLSRCSIYSCVSRSKAGYKILS